MLRCLLLTALLASPAVADVEQAVDGPILPGFARFTAATVALDAAAQADCAPQALRPAWNAAFDAWMGVSHLTLGPMEDQGFALAIAFWPDPKAQGQKALDALVTSGNPALLKPATFAEQSVAVRGLFTLERLLYTEPQDAFRCAITRAVASDLARMAAATEAGWTGAFADALETAGSAGNSRFLSPAEARQALFTAFLSGLEVTADDRLGRPLGTFDKPRPERAEARASGRSQRNVTESLTALRALAVALVPDSPLTQGALDRAITLSEKLGDPDFSGVTDPTGRLKLEILQQAVFAARDTAQTELGAALAVSEGFNAGDGD